MQIAIDTERWTVAIDGKEVKLTKKEFCILRELLNADGRVLTRNQLVERVYEDTPECNTRIIDMHVARLRKKMEHAKGRLETVREVGYKLANA